MFSALSLLSFLAMSRASRICSSSSSLSVRTWNMFLVSIDLGIDAITFCFIPLFKCPLILGGDELIVYVLSVHGLSFEGV